MLTTHLGSTLGWFGAVAAFLALAIVGLSEQNEQVVRGIYVAMDRSAWLVILPFCFLSSISGIAQSLGTKWGLFKHYWIIVKLALTTVATVILLLHMQPISQIADMAMKMPISGAQFTAVKVQLIANAAAALLVLAAITAISVYKPWGKVGVRTTGSQSVVNKDVAGTFPWVKSVALILIAVAILVFVLLHLTTGGLGHH